ncbi:Glycoside hydrolase family 5 protein [Mycena kentingensis (nom. inval.)]|nr:Glycoside hydrolase family 5 protein [Mycena kentingensis (nom. inval.)]
MRVLFHLSLVSSVLAFTPGFPYGSTKVRGVNLGGWLVLEPWITPSLFDDTGNANIIDEYTFGKLQNKATATATLKTHWDTWITEADFKAIKAAGLNHVRLPIGYWAFEVGPGEPYIQGQLPYLTKAITWATNNGLKLIIDLHGYACSPGSQNGFDNSGQKLSFPGWHSNSTNVKRTNDIIKTIANMVKNNVANVPIIAPLNEPAGFYGDDVLTGTILGETQVSIRFPFGTSQQSNTVVMIHDAFQPLSYWNGVLAYPQYEGVAMDTHIYTIFSVPEVQMSEQQHIDTVCAKGSSLASFGLWTVVGEWTPARTDCAKYLNGRGVGSRYDGTYPGTSGTRVGSCSGLSGSASSFSSSYKTYLRRFWEAQVQTYERGAGWCAWTWKTEAGTGEEWSYQKGLQFGWIPQNPTSYQFPNACG